MLEREREVFERAPAMSAGDWSRLWLTRVAGFPEEGADGWMGTWGEQEWAMAEVVRREAWAGAALVEALVRRIGVEVVVEGSGHLPPVEEPERCNGLLRRAWAVPGSGGKW